MNFLLKRRGKKDKKRIETDSGVTFGIPHGPYSCYLKALYVRKPIVGP